MVLTISSSTPIKKVVKVETKAADDVPFKDSTPVAPISKLKLGGKGGVQIAKIVTVQEDSMSLPEDIEQEIARLEALEPAAVKLAEQIKKAQSKLKPFTDSMKVLGERITEHLTAQGVDADKEEILHGGIKDLRVSKMGNERTITDMEKLLDVLQENMGDEKGQDVFLSIVSATWKEVDKYLTKAQQAPFTKSVRTSRTATFIEKMN